MKPLGILLISLALILPTLGSSFSGLMSFPNPKDSSMSAYVSSSGEITILKDVDGYYVYADLSDSGTSVGQVTNDTAKMMLGLSSSDVLLIQDCLGFKQYSCPYYHCNKLPNNQQTISYPDFTAETIQAAASVYLDHAYWELQTKALLATSCSTQRTDLKGNNRYGVIGLGTQGASKGNFLKNKIFSIYFSPDVKNGTLRFSAKNFDRSYFWESFMANANWVIPSRGWIQFGGFTQGFTGNFVFDINADAIGLPTKFFELFIRLLQEREWMQGLSCTHDVFQPTCNYTGYIRDLPEIEIYPDQTRNYQGRGRIDIKPEVYVLNAKSKDDHVSSITLNFQMLSSSASGKSYVTSDYENTIILDARAMSSFYIIFNATGSTNTISFYEGIVMLPNSTSDSIFDLSQYSGWHFIVIGVILFVSVAVSCAVLKKCNGKGAQASPVIIVDNSTTVVNATTQNNYFVGQQGVQYVPPPPHHQNIGVYQGNQCL